MPHTEDPEIMHYAHPCGCVAERKGSGAAYLVKHCTEVISTEDEAELLKGGICCPAHNRMVVALCNTLGRLRAELSGAAKK